MIVFVLTFTLVLFSYVWLKRAKRPAGFPPGPPTEFIFGNMSTIMQATRGDFRAVLYDLREKHNQSIIGLVDMFGNRVVHVFDADMIRDLSSRTEFSGRPVAFPILYRGFMKKQGLLFSEGSLWQEHRRFALSHLRTLGFGKSSMNDAIVREFEQVAEDLRNEIGKPVQVDESYFNLASLNVIWKMVVNKRYNKGEPEAVNLINLANEMAKIIGPQNIMNVFPWLRHVIPELSGFRAMKRHRTANAEMFQRQIDEHRRSRDPDNPKDFLDSYVGRMEAADAKERGFTEENMCVIGMDFFVAGSETTASTMRWAILLSSIHTDAQTAVQQELDTEVGRERTPRYDDRRQLPFTEAFLMETLRFGGVVSQTVPHATSFGVAQFGSYTLPKDTIILMHLDTLNKSKQLWGDPENFRPQRFLDESGQLLVPDYFMPFGIGKRACLGESLARMEIFIFFSCLMQRFRFRLPPGNIPNLEPEYGVFLRAPKFSVITEMR